jgi:hypothetical protein
MVVRILCVESLAEYQKMTVILDLDQRQEERLRSAAVARGVEADALANEIMRKALEEYDAPVTSRPKRILGLKAAGLRWIADDFDAPLPDSFWLGEE